MAERNEGEGPVPVHAREAERGDGARRAGEGAAPKRAREGPARDGEGPRATAEPASATAEEDARDEDQGLDAALVRPREPGEPDVLLDVPDLHVEEITLDVENLHARVALHAAVGQLVSLDVGADVDIERVALAIRGVQAQALLKVRLERVYDILARTLTTVDRNPDLLRVVLQPVGELVRDVGQTVEETVPELGRGVARTVEETVPEAGRDVARTLEETVPEVERTVVPTVPRSVPEVGGAVGATASAAGTVRTAGEAARSPGPTERTDERAAPATKNARAPDAPSRAPASGVARTRAETAAENGAPRPVPGPGEQGFDARPETVETGARGHASRARADRRFAQRVRKVMKRARDVVSAGILRRGSRAHRS